MVKFIHTGDWQLGMTRHFLHGEAQARYSQARLDAVRRIADLARDRECDFVVVCGDVFESNLLDRRTVLRSLDTLRAFDVPLFLLPGNHDPIDPTSIYSTAMFRDGCPPGVEVLAATEPRRLDGVDVTIYGAPWESKRPLSDLVTAACESVSEVSAGYRIVIGHGAVDRLVPDLENPAIIRADDVESHLRSGEVHFVALGDRHSATSIGDTNRFWYSGTPLVTDYDEIEPNHVLLVTLSDDGIEVERVLVGDWQFISRSFDVNTDDDIDVLESWLDSIDDKQRTVVKAALTGTLSLAQHAKLEEVLERSRQVLAALERPEHHDDVHILANLADVEALALSGYAKEALDELMEASRRDDGESSSAQDALALLYRLAGGAR